MSRNLSTFAARGLFQGTDAHGRWLADGPAEASWLVQNWGRYSHHKLACVFLKYWQESEYKYKNISNRRVFTRRVQNSTNERARTNSRGQNHVGKQLFKKNVDRNAASRHKTVQVCVTCIQVYAGSILPKHPNYLNPDTDWGSQCERGKRCF